ncbi:MAG: NAD-dependent epimerase [Actinophytocola sp.]|uniref:NAD-dependent epimerase/dehydratase family protein n=1 Tax=Actinophytocola sp. TaxID=1872138 RepID=UPI001322EFEA|nr:NAD-dependent epimerase/dehydratase family protein [Actinophytocola sp.]MPZ81081.1 NAD-dependent epimerase [Actinophytocola sp.]
MALHVIVGAGPVGTATATLLADRGEQVRVVTRSGSGPAHPAIERVAADATDADRLSSLAEGAVALYNCASPQYHRWLTDWPPIASALLTAAERGGAVLAAASNLYGYGEVDAPITADTPLAATHPKLKLRADMWRAALAAHEAGKIRATEVRSSDYIEANSIFNAVLAKPLRAGKRANVPAALDTPHSWTAIADVARTLATVATDERGWGKAWLVPTNPPLTVRQLATRFTEVNGLPPAKVGGLPYPVLWTAGLFSPMIRELRTTRYQFIRPFVIDSSLTEHTFGLTPTDLNTALKNVAA